MRDLIAGLIVWLIVIALVMNWSSTIINYVLEMFK